MSAACVLMPGESLEDRQREVDGWNATFGSSTPGEAWLATRIADAMRRLGRLDALARIAEEAGIESAIKKSDVYTKFSTANDALQAVRALAFTAEGVAAAVDGDGVSRLAPAMRRTLELAEAADIPMAALMPLQNAMNTVIVDCVLGAGTEAFHELGRAARAVEGALAPMFERAQREVEAEKKRLALDPTLGDEDALRRFGRYRSRLVRELDELLRLLREIRELAAPTDAGSGSFVHVELRVVGRANLAGD